MTIPSLGEALEEQTKKQVHPLKDLNFSNKINELKQIESIFPKKPVEWFDYW